MKLLVVYCALLCVWLSAACAQSKPKTWKQAEMADFDKGTLTGLSLSSEGRLTLAPAVKEIFDGSVAFLWAVARDSKGNVYAAGGGLGATKAKLFAVDPQGKVKTLAELDGIAIQAIAIDAADRVYAATSPDGKVYRVDAAGKADVFYDPKAKYIWALAFDKAGNLYVATGDQGEIHRVTPAGAGSVFFSTEETHARSLAVDASGKPDRGHRSRRADPARDTGRPGFRAVSGSQARDYSGGGGRRRNHLRRGGGEQGRLRLLLRRPRLRAAPAPVNAAWVSVRPRFLRR